MSDQIKYKLLKRREFSKREAEVTVWYELHEFSPRKRFLRKPTAPYWRISTYRSYNRDGLPMTVEATGNIEWAKKIAKEYKITVPRTVSKDE